MPGELRVKRVYDAPEAADGWRVLVDRLWPRGLSREKARADEWVKGIAPADALRRAFGHMPERYPAFAAAYRTQLAADPAAAAFASACRERLAAGNVTLLYAARDPLLNNARVLREWLLENR